MPFWGWVLFIACLSGLLVASVLMIVRATRRLRSREPLHGDPANFAATVPVHVSEADSLTARELEEERGRVDEAERLSGTPTARRPATRP